MLETKFQTFYGQKKVSTEHYEPGTSETEPGQEVSIHAVYERCLRGELIPNAGTAYYEEEIGVLEHPDSDLADVATLADYLSEKASRGEEATDGKSNVDPSKSNDGRVSDVDDEAKNSSEDK